MPDYPSEWPEIAKAVKDAAGWRCLRCRHPHETPSNPADCDDECNLIFHPETWQLIPYRRQRILTVHHLDGRKMNMAHWNLAALCQVCHLFIQGVTQHRMDIFYEREDFMKVEVWLLPFALGWAKDMGIATLAQNYAPPLNWSYLVKRWSKECAGLNVGFREGENREQ